MQKAIVATARVSDVSELAKQIETLQFGDPSYYMLQCPNEITNWEKGIPDTTEIEAHIHGRLFDKNGELRWQKAKRGYALLWLSEGDLPDGFNKFKLGEWQMSESQDIYLLGGGETKPWRDTRIPRKLKYPITWCKYPGVKIIQYKESNSQTIHFTRYTEFIAIKGA